MTWWISRAWYLCTGYIISFYLLTLCHTSKKINACHIHNVRMKNCNFKIKFSRTNKKSECISVYGPKMWNDLPADIKLCTSMFTFKKMYLCNNNFWGMLLISLNFLHSPSTFSVCSIVPNNVQQCTMCGVQLLFSDCYYVHWMCTILGWLCWINSIQFNSKFNQHT